MKTRSTQSGPRENTASSRQHASRLVVSSSPLGSDPLLQGPTENVPSWPPEISRVKAPVSFMVQLDKGATVGERADRSRLLTIKEVAELLRVPVSWVYGRTRRRALERLPGYRLGKYWRFSEDEVLAWVKCQHGGPRAS